MQTIDLPAPDGTIQAVIAHPDGAGPWPGVVIVHDAIGFGEDVRKHVTMLAERGYLAIAPNLFSRGKTRCIRSVMRALWFTGGRNDGDSVPVRDILAARDHLLADPRCTGRTAVIGFCMGGGFALLCAPHGFDASAPFYPGLYGDFRSLLDGACPIVASYAGIDPSLIGAGEKLRRSLIDLGVPHDIKTYPKAAHGFANTFAAEPLLRVTGLGYDATATADAWQRIFTFFDRHLTEEPSPN
ncbi:MAG TPA: dienelactone hydrolase family protein [Nocardia sp.]|uniref:dienelactone hydrolase family protein n=1 Tax=Nocardia sp. TaxID=1821 RepID=UPI002B4B7B37|nr:dienelactone hydrolase family protein [Nocardia sp.]HLS79116.1 dienelactone hydrolase family protein [Nocardia sp.]